MQKFNLLVKDFDDIDHLTMAYYLNGTLCSRPHCSCV